MTRDMNRGVESSEEFGSARLIELLSAVARGDRTAFSALYVQTSAKLFGICIHLLRSEAEAQDVLQDVYLTVWRKADRFDARKASAITWLAVLTRNKAIDRLRRKTIPSDGIEAAGAIEDDSPSALELAEEADESARLKGCLDELDDRPRAMIRAAFLEGASYPELATREGVPLGTMKSWIRRGLQRLRGCMDR